MRKIVTRLARTRARALRLECLPYQEPERICLCAGILCDGCGCFGWELLRGNSLLAEDDHPIPGEMKEN